MEKVLTGFLLFVLYLYLVWTCCNKYNTLYMQLLNFKLQLT